MIRTRPNYLACPHDFHPFSVPSISSCPIHAKTRARRNSTLACPREMKAWTLESSFQRSSTHNANKCNLSLRWRTDFPVPLLRSEYNSIFSRMKNLTSQPINLKDLSKTQENTKSNDNIQPSKTFSNSCFINSHSMLESPSQLPPIVLNDHDVLVQVQASSVNALDIKVLHGYAHSLFSSQRSHVDYPSILGRDLSGVIVKCGEKVWDWKVGDEVVGASWPWQQFGTWAEYAAISQFHIVKKPKQISHEDAAALAFSGITAWHAVFHFTKTNKGKEGIIINKIGRSQPNAMVSAQDPHLLNGCDLKSPPSMNVVPQVKPIEEILDEATQIGRKVALVYGGAGAVGNIVVQLLNLLNEYVVLVISREEDRGFLQGIMNVAHFYNIDQFDRGQQAKYAKDRTSDHNSTFIDHHVVEDNISKPSDHVVEISSSSHHESPSHKELHEVSDQSPTLMPLFQLPQHSLDLVIDCASGSFDQAKSRELASIAWLKQGGEYVTTNGQAINFFDTTHTNYLRQSHQLYSELGPTEVQGTTMRTNANSSHNPPLIRSAFNLISRFTSQPLSPIIPFVCSAFQTLWKSFEIRNSIQTKNNINYQWAYFHPNAYALKALVLLAGFGQLKQPISKIVPFQEADKVIQHLMTRISMKTSEIVDEGREQDMARGRVNGKIVLKF